MKNLIPTWNLSFLAKVMATVTCHEDTTKISYDDDDTREEKRERKKYK